MIDTLAPARSPDPARLARPAAEAAGTPLTLAARLELRLGLWLLLRSARHNRGAHDRDQRALRAGNARSLSARDHDALRAYALSSVRT